VVAEVLLTAPQQEPRRGVFRRLAGGVEQERQRLPVPGLNHQLAPGGTGVRRPARRLLLGLRAAGAFLILRLQQAEKRRLLFPQSPRQVLGGAVAFRLGVKFPRGPQAALTLVARPRRLGVDRLAARQDQQQGSDRSVQFFTLLLRQVADQGPLAPVWVFQ